MVEWLPIHPPRAMLDQLQTLKTKWLAAEIKMYNVCRNLLLKRHAMNQSCMLTRLNYQISNLGSIVISSSHSSSSKSCWHTITRFPLATCYLNNINIFVIIPDTSTWPVWPKWWPIGPLETATVTKITLCLLWCHRFFTSELFLNNFELRHPHWRVS